MNRTLKRVGIFGATLGGVVAIAAASFAFFTAATSVNATGETQTTQAVRVTGATVETLRPGVCADVTFTLHNDSNVMLTGISKVNGVSASATGGASGHLHLASYLHAGSTPVDLAVGGYAFEPIPADGTKQVTFKDAVCMDLGAGDDAQGQTTTVGLNLLVKQANGGEYTSVS